MKLSHLAAALAISGALFFSIHGYADEGMWTFDNPPLKLLHEQIRLRAHPAVARPRAPLFACA